MPWLSFLSPEEPGSPEPWGIRLWATLALVLVVATAVQSYGVRTWPMADDEVPSLVELKILDIDAATFSVPKSKVGRLARSLPVWYGLDRRLIALLPAGELSYRLPSLGFAIATSALVFLMAARKRGLGFGLALVMVLLGSQPFVYLSQLNRFYAMPLFVLAVTYGVIWSSPARAALKGLVTVALAGVAVLSHNLLMPVFVLAFMAAAAGSVVGLIPRHVLLRTILAAATGVALYLAYIRPLIQGWNSTGNPTPVLVSFAAHAGIVTLALAGLGIVFVLTRAEGRSLMVWAALMFVGSFCVFLLADISWNPRYFALFMPAMWLLAAHAIDAVRRAVRSSLLAVGWYGCVALMFAPGILSHYQDGSRHDYRQAASVVLAHATAGQPILSDDAETISYYLPAEARRRLLVRTKVTEFPANEFLLVVRANVWMPLPSIPGRRLDLLAEIFHRRFDQFSHVLRVYRVPSLAAVRGG